ncbi:TPA: hypothetical protein HA225_02735, partial [Candidatus Micrarchaeota archaeon]|nr:hypothetical protein [Candidatus Micrarchaeota archaeon]
MNEAAVVVKYKKEAITDYFKANPVEGMKLAFIDQGERYGTAAAFGYAEGFATET